MNIDMVGMVLHNPETFFKKYGWGGAPLPPHLYSRKILAKGFPAYGHAPPPPVEKYSEGGMQRRVPLDGGYFYRGNPRAIQQCFYIIEGIPKFASLVWPALPLLVIFLQFWCFKSGRKWPGQYIHNAHACVRQYPASDVVLCIDYCH